MHSDAARRADLESQVRHMTELLAMENASFPSDISNNLTTSSSKDDDPTPYRVSELALKVVYMVVGTVRSVHCTQMTAVAARADLQRQLRHVTDTTVSDGERIVSQRCLEQLDDVLVEG